MKICEIYESIQGESTFTGLPFLFIRLTGCNLRCNYCDTVYAYEEGIEYTLDELLKIIKRYKQRRIAITGGEPLFQKETILLLNILIEQNYFVSLETNGSISISDVPESVVIVMDIKTPGSGQNSFNYWQNIDLLRPYDEIKFVITNKNDFLWAADVIKKYNLDKRFQVLISPEASYKHKKKLVSWLLKSNLDIRLQLQMHKIIWKKNKRGV